MSIFISYKREEFSYADQLRLSMEELGYEVWWDKDLQTGSAWAGVLDQQLAQATCVIVLWSKRATKSPWVRHEASGAMARETYVPVKIEACDVPDPFSRIHAAELMGWDGSRHHVGFEAMLASVKERMRATPSAVVLRAPELHGAWPTQVPRDAVARFAGWVKQHAAMLVAGLALTALARLAYDIDASTTGLGDQATRAEKSIGALEERLQQVTTQLGEIVSAQVDAEWRLAAQTTDSAQLVVKIDELNRSVAHSVEAERALVRDRLKREDTASLRVSIEVDPEELANAEGHDVFSEAAWLAIRDGYTVPLEHRPAIESAKQALLRNWSLKLLLRRRGVTQVLKTIDFKHQSGVDSLLLAPKTQGSDTLAISVTYEMKVRELLGASDVNEFPGATLEVHVSQPFVPFRLEEVELALGTSPLPTMAAFDNNQGPACTAVAKLVMPEDYLVAATMKQKVR